MRNSRSLTVCRSLLPRGVSALGGGVCSQGRGCLIPGGVCSQGVVSQHALRQTPPLWTEWQTGVKILPWPQLREIENSWSVVYQCKCCVEFCGDFNVGITISTHGISGSGSHVLFNVETISGIWSQNINHWSVVRDLQKVSTPCDLQEVNGSNWPVD